MDFERLNNQRKPINPGFPLAVFMASAGLLMLASSLYGSGAFSRELSVGIGVCSLPGFVFVFFRFQKGLYEIMYGPVNRYREYLSTKSKTQLLEILEYKEELEPYEVVLIKSVLSDKHPGWSREKPSEADRQQSSQG